MAYKRFVIPKETLRGLYWRKRLTSSEIARLFGCTAGTVINLMKEHGIRRRNSGPTRVKINQERLTKLYVHRRFSARAIAGMYRCDQGVILRALRHYKISARHPKAPAKVSRDGLYILYCRRGLSAYKIAEHYRCSSGTIYRYLKFYKIPIRSQWRFDISKKDLVDLYIYKKYSLGKIAHGYKCSSATVLNKMRIYKIPRRSISETSTKHPKKDFVGSIKEKAYMVGFRLGDLGVRRRNYLIYISSGTTKDAQVVLIRDLFKNYGPIWIGKKNLQGAVNISCSLNKSFSFLLPKYPIIPRWIGEIGPTFFSFLAGYTDAEGNITVSQGRARFRLRSYDKGILRGCHKRLRRLGIRSLFGLDKKAGVDRSGTKRNKDSWFLAVNEKKSLSIFLTKLRPLLRHEKRRYDLDQALSNVLSRL